MSEIQRISVHNMQKDAQELEQELKGLPNDITKLQEAMNRLAGCWDGPAWAAYQEQVTEDIQKMREIYGVLVQLQKALGEAGNIYLRAEYDVYTDFNHLWI